MQLLQWFVFGGSYLFIFYWRMKTRFPGFKFLTLYILVHVYQKYTYNYIRICWFKKITPKSRTSILVYMYRLSVLNLSLSSQGRHVSAIYINIPEAKYINTCIMFTTSWIVKLAHISTVSSLLLYIFPYTETKASNL